MELDEQRDDLRELILNEERFDLVYDNLPVGVTVWDNNGYFVRMNPRNMEIFGIKDTKPLNGFCIFDDRNVEPEHLNNMKEKDDFTFYYHLNPLNLNAHGTCHLQDEKRLFCSFHRVYNDANEPIGFILVNVDATKVQNDLRDETEILTRQLRQVHYSANMMTWRWDMKSGKIVANRSYAPSALADKLSGLLDTSVGEFLQNLHPEDRHIFLENYEKLLQKKVDTAEIDARFNFKGTNLGYVWVHFSAMVSEFDKDGSAKTLVGSTMIIEDRKRLEEELRKAKDRAVASDRMKTCFIEQTNHEIRTPLNAIVGYADILATCCNSLNAEEMHDIIKNIRDNSTLMTEMVGNMLYASQLYSGNLDHDNNSFSALDLCSRLWVKYMTRPAKGVQLRQHNVDGKDCIISCDAKLIEIVLDNLLSNASKFTEKGTITYGFEEVPEGLKFWVADTGPGLPEDLDMYAPFAKGSNFVQGMGLGLPLCRGLVNFMGGKLVADSAPGKGCTFSFVLPNRT